MLGHFRAAPERAAISGHLKVHLMITKNRASDFPSKYSVIVVYINLSIYLGPLLDVSLSLCVLGSPSTLCYPPTHACDVNEHVNCGAAVLEGATTTTTKNNDH